MKFQKGNKFAKGGRRNPPGGRPTKKQQEIKKAAAEIAKEFIETHVQRFLDSYLDLGTGKVIERLDKDGNVVKLVMLDPATVRHAIDKILPDEQMQHPQPLQIMFQDFARPSQLPAEELAALTGYWKRPDRANDLPADPCRSRLPLPAPSAEEKTQIEHPQVTFHDFARKRRE
jgi:hypothetical protein